MPENTAEISAPAEDTAPDTSLEETETKNTASDTSDNESASIDEAAGKQQTENTQNAQPAAEPEKLYAGKYKTLEDFEKGHSALNAELTRLQQKEAERRRQDEAQNALRLEQARQQGFETAEAQETAQRAAIAEFDAYCRAVNMLAPEFMETAKQNLLNYYNTGNKAYLDEAKRYFSSELIENIALEKQQFISRLNSEYREQAQKAFTEQEMKLSELIKSEYGDFLSDLKENTGKSEALKMFCNAGFIQSKEDFKVFTDIYNAMAGIERARAVKEYEAQKKIEAEKQKAVISGGSAPLSSGTKPSAADIERMSQKEFDAYCDKYGIDWIYEH